MNSRFLLLVFFCVCGKVFAAGAMNWPEVKVENRPGAYWWWMGSAVDKENITWNLETMREAGMGGAHIVPIYGVKGYEKKYLRHLSPEFVEMVSHAVKEAKRLGMWVDMTTGTGWPFGGPMITTEYCDAKVVYKDGEISQQFSGRRVKRPAPGNVGAAINPFSARAMAFYLKHFDAPFDREGVAMPRAMYHDSYEFEGNWTKELPEEFRRRRGYDLMAHLPALFGQGGDADTVARIKADYRETLSDLHLDYLTTWVEWSASKGCTTRNQAHGSPSNLLDLYAASGIPETEVFGASVFKIPGIRRAADNVRKDHSEPLMNLFASSAAHVAGRPLVSSESCTWIRNHFRTALSQAKPEIDQFFLTGINHIFFHGTCYSPQEAPWPGWLFYASFQYNPRNAIWRDAPLFNAYITRCQSILQSGKPDNDVAVYWPVHDVWHNPSGMQQMLNVFQPSWLTGSPCGKAAMQLRADGFGFDYISDRQLVAGLSAPYKAIVVPRTEHMPLPTLSTLLELAASGRPVLFLDSFPADVPGFNTLEERRATLKRLRQGRENLVVQSADLRKALENTARREPMVEQGLDFIRRRHDSGCHYFVANMSAATVDAWVPLGVPFASAAIMNPRSAATGLATQHENQIYLQLKPGETRIIRTFDTEKVVGDKWPLLVRHGEPLTVKGTWKIRFVGGGPKLPADITTTALESWTAIGDVEAQRFAGTGRYAIEIDLPKDAADDWEIDLGDVRESARVFINGKEAAGLYSVPYSAPVGQYLQGGRNLLEIEVTNLSANRIRDLDIRKVNWKIFHEINFVDHNYKKFDASRWPLTPSGLLGPVTLTPMKTYSPKQ